jgi:hypothetical protein
LIMRLVICLVAVAVAVDEQSMAMEFGRFQELTEKWFLEGKKQHLKQAYKSARTMVPYLAGLPAFPEGLDALQLADRIISLAQKPKHIKIGIPLVFAVLDKHLIDGEPVVKKCGKDEIYMRRTCQDVYALLIRALWHTNQTVAAQKWTETYNAPRPLWRQFSRIEHVHRQLPGIDARPWLNAEELPPVYDVLQSIKAGFSLIKQEVLGRADSLPWNPLANDPTLTVNTKWDPRSSWDSINLYWKGSWVDEHCSLLPETCKLLKQHAAQLEPLFDRDAFSQLSERFTKHQAWREPIPPSLQLQDYDEVPTLGIKIYRIWPQSGLKAHTGSPGRIVNSMALHAPEGSSLTVAGERKEWVEGAMHHFDDSFVHAVDNPHATEHRIVMAIVTWHPDFYLPSAERRSEL